MAHEKESIYAAGKIEINFRKIGEIKKPSRAYKEMTLIEVNGEWLEQCDNCGNIWDGNAQCPCWQINQEEEEEDHEEEDQEDDDYSDSGYETE